MEQSGEAWWSGGFFNESYIELFKSLGKFDNTSCEIAQILELLQLTPPAKILDVPCGFGRHSSLLSQRGFEVVGVDLCESFLKNAKKQDCNGRYILSDMRFIPENGFDAVLNLWTSFGYLGSKEEDQRALCAWVDALKLGGQLLIETTDLERAMFENRSGQEAISYKETKVNGVEECSKFYWEKQRGEVSYTFNGESRSCIVRIYTQEELIEMLKPVGMEVVGVYGSFGMGEKRPSNRCIIHSRKIRGN